MKKNYLFASLIAVVAISSCSSVITNATTNGVFQNNGDIPEYVYKNRNTSFAVNQSLPDKISLKVDTAILNNVFPNEKIDKKVLNFIESKNFNIQSKNDANIRKSNLLGNNITSLDHVKYNDKNIFNPNDLSSLGGLIPAEYGEIKTKNASVGVVSVNDKNNAIFTSNLITAKVLAPVDQNIKKLLEKYKAELISRNDNDGTIITIKPDLKYVDLSNIEDNIAKVNSNSPMVINSLSFSSINMAKTLAVFFDILANSSTLASNVGLEYAFKANSADRVISPQNSRIVTDEEQNNGKFEYYENCSSSEKLLPLDQLVNFCNNSVSHYPKDVPNTSFDSYWISTTNIDSAWNYSLGQNTKVAVMDTDFGNTYLYLSEIPLRVESINLDYLNKNTNIEILDLNKYPYAYRGDDPTIKCDFIYNKDLRDMGACNILKSGNYGHGSNISSLLFSSIDDKNGISGIVPRAKFLPMGLDNIYVSGNLGIISFFTSKLEDIKRYNNDNQSKDGISVINISSSVETGGLSKVGNAPSCANIITKNGDDVTCDSNLIKISNLINDISNTKSNPNYNPNKISTVIVSSAGNGGKDMDIDGRFLYPFALKNVLGVGAYELSFSGNKKRADFNPKVSDVGNPETSSNYGFAIDVWAPGDNIPIMNYITNLVTDSVTKKWNTVNGTSFSSPITAGVVALLKSIRPDLTVGQISQIFHNSGEEALDPSFLSSVNTGQRCLNASEAIDYLIKNSPSDKIVRKKAVYLVATYLSAGKLQFDTSEPRVYTITDIIPNYPEYYKDLIGKQVIVSGWWNNDNKFEVLQMREYISTLTYNAKSIPIVYSNVPTTVKSGDQIAIPITSSIKDQLNNVFIGGIQLTLLEIVQNYAIYNVPDLGKSTGIVTSSLIDIVIKNNLGQTVETLADALKILLTALEQKSPQLLGMFFNGYQGIPSNFVFDNALSNDFSLYPYTSKLFDSINFVNAERNYGDTFGMGLYDNYTAIFKGFIKLPNSYPSGNYTFILGHDDGASFYFNGSGKILAPGFYNYTEHYASVYMEKDIYYPISIPYSEAFVEAELGLFWIKPDGSREFVPASAFFH